jgi:hypothetical protein
METQCFTSFAIPFGFNHLRGKKWSNFTRMSRNCTNEAIVKSVSHRWKARPRAIVT